MKLWWANVVKDYLTFTPKERRGVFVTIALCVTIYLVGHYFPVSDPPVDEHAFQQELSRLKVLVDTVEHTSNYHRASFPGHYTLSSPTSVSPGQLFSFDPNTLDAEGWKKLGIRDRTIQTIHNFLAKGLRFRQAEDIRKIYGMRKAEADRLIPLVTISKREFQPVGPVSMSPAKKDDAPAVYKARMIDINLADTSELIALPGIGSKLAARIVKFREKLGGFYSVDQLGETYGVPDSTFQMVKNRLQCINPVTTKININSAGANDLKNHPYINWNVANAIVNYRTQHGNYNSIEDLQKIEIISDELFHKLAPYLVL